VTCRNGADSRAVWLLSSCVVRYRFLFMGAQQPIRNPAAHERFHEMDDDEAFELLGLASHLMGKLDEVTFSKS
jgi:hypothetical protein